MRGTDVLCCLIAATLAVLPTFARPDGVEQRTTCDTSSLNSSCKKNERCVEGSNGVQACECNRDFYFDINKKECVKLAPTVTSVNTTDFKPEQRSESEGGGSSVAAGLLIPTFLIVVGVLLYFGARRYKWLQRFRQYRHNRYGNVIVTRDDDDDDDPPIA
ncbi:hypothetical protein PUN28_001101 [Cardiocondyla obscurior]|uniref:EGF-like domain-containing protein n=1 Tax=Cardiocondyla obscurior TaxID=286306 RepID=A0AAW2H2Y2_9HYME